MLYAEVIILFNFIYFLKLIVKIYCVPSCIYSFFSEQSSWKLMYRDLLTFISHTIPYLGLTFDGHRAVDVQGKQCNIIVSRSKQIILFQCIVLTRINFRKQYNSSAKKPVSPLELCKLGTFIILPKFNVLNLDYNRIQMYQKHIRQSHNLGIGTHHGQTE